MLSVPQVLAVYHLTGSHDFMLHVAVQSSEHLRAFAMDGITSRPEVVHIETHLIFRYTRNPVHPQYLD
jgi:DNA-binding Lrp family transcriptional regulator